MLTRADKPFIGLVKKHNCRPVPLYGVALNTNKLFAHLWVARFVFSSLLFKPHGFLIPLMLFCIYLMILLSRKELSHSALVSIYRRILTHSVSKPQISTFWKKKLIIILKRGESEQNSRFFKTCYFSSGEQGKKTNTDEIPDTHKSLS